MADVNIGKVYSYSCRGKAGIIVCTHGVCVCVCVPTVCACVSQQSQVARALCRISLLIETEAAGSIPGHEFGVVVSLNKKLY